MGLEAVGLYRKMPHPLCSEATYVCVLNACSHSGLVDEAHSIFNEIPQKTNQITTTMVCLFVLSNINIILCFRLIV
jgi:pentatricopeptide repeat protein